MSKKPKAAPAYTLTERQRQKLQDALDTVNTLLEEVLSFEAFVWFKESEKLHSKTTDVLQTDAHETDPRTLTHLRGLLAAYEFIQEHLVSDDGYDGELWPIFAKDVRKNIQQVIDVHEELPNVP